jgi:signal transduction histidine kinase
VRASNREISEVWIALNAGRKPSDTLSSAANLFQRLRRVWTLDDTFKVIVTIAGQSSAEREHFVPRGRPVVKHFLSIGTLLSAITGLFVVMLVSIFAVSASGAYDHKRDATHILSVVNDMRRIFSAKDILRNEMSVIDLALGAPNVASAGTVRRIIALHTKSEDALESMVGQLSAPPLLEIMPDLVPLHRRGAIFSNLLPQVIAAVKLPLAQRPRTLSADFTMAARSLADAISDQSKALSGRIASADPFINEMMKINAIAWIVRADAGTDRGNITKAIAKGRALSLEQIRQFEEATGRIDAPWGVIEDDARLPFLPQKLKAEIQGANELYFIQFRAVRKSVIDKLTSGKTESLSAPDWANLSNPGLTSIATISKTALDLTEDHVARQVAVARQQLYFAIFLMVLSIGVASLTFLYVMWRVIRPLNLITQIMKAIAKGNLRHNIPFKDRNDEIGQFANALHVFRDGAIEKQRLETESIRNLAAKETAERSNRVKSEFLAVMSHELRTPLNAILGFSEMIGREVLGPGAAQYREYANDIHGAGAHLLTLINDILDLSKAEAGKLELTSEPVDLNDLIKECARLVRGRAVEQKLRITLRVALLPLLLIDRLRVKQILLNLLSNAIKFTPEGGVVSVLADRDAIGGVVICVCDTGIGIAPEMIPLAFEPFRQIDSALSRKFPGTGLGLSLVKTFVELHGGEVKIESNLGKGTLVFIVFPKSRCSETPKAVSA